MFSGDGKLVIIPIQNNYLTWNSSKQRLHRFLIYTLWHCSWTVGGGHKLRLPPYTVLSFHPIETNGMLHPGPFHLLPQIPFSHPFNLDSSFHTTVSTLPWKHNGYQSVALSARQSFICWEAYTSWKAFCYLSLMWLNDFFLWFVTCHFSSHTENVSFALFRCDNVAWCIGLWMPYLKLDL